MPEQDLAIQGEDISITVTVGGILKLIQDQVTSFTRKSESDSVETKNIGTDGTKIRRTFTKWSGTIEFAETRKTLDEINDLVMAARRDNIPLIVGINEKGAYRNGTKVTHTYVDVVWGDVESTATRAEARKVTVPWESGSHRLTR